MLHSAIQQRYHTLCRPLPGYWECRTCKNGCIARLLWELPYRPVATPPFSTSSPHLQVVGMYRQDFSFSTCHELLSHALAHVWHGVRDVTSPTHPSVDALITTHLPPNPTHPRTTPPGAQGPAHVTWHNDPQGAPTFTSFREWAAAQGEAGEAPLAGVTPATVQGCADDVATTVGASIPPLAVQHNPCAAANAEQLGLAAARQLPFKALPQGAAQRPL